MIEYEAPKMLNEDLSKLYDVITDDGEIVISAFGFDRKEYAGTYELTAYIETGYPCADGDYPQVGHTAACNDPDLWHKWVHIDGYGDYYIHDTGGMASNVIDIFVASYDEAIQFGRREADVYIIEKE